MAGTTIMVAGVAITDITSYRAKLTATQVRLKTIYTGFDPARPDLLLPRAVEIVELANNAERLRELVERWDAAEAQCATVLEVWELVKAFTGDKA